MSKTKTLAWALLAIAGTTAGAAAQAGQVNWSIDIHAPVAPGISVGTVISNGAPALSPARVAVAPTPVYVAPAAATPIVYQPVRVVPQPLWIPARWERGIWMPGYWQHAQPVQQWHRGHERHRHRHDHRGYRHSGDHRGDHDGRYDRDHDGHWDRGGERLPAPQRGARFPG